MSAKKTTPSKSPSTLAAPGKTAIARAASDAKLVTNARKNRAEALLDLIARRKARIAEDFYEVGKALKELLEKKLYVALEYPSFKAMLEARDVMGDTQAYKLIEVVSRVPLKTALDLGLEKAFALTRYTSATPELDSPELLLESGAKIGDKPAAEATKRDIEEATKKLRKEAAAKKGKADPAEREAERAAKQGRAWLKGRGAKKGKVEVRRTKDGHVVVVTLPVAEAVGLFGG